MRQSSNTILYNLACFLLPLCRSPLCQSGLETVTTINEAYVNGVFDYYVMNYYNYAMSKFKEHSNRYTPVVFGVSCSELMMGVELAPHRRTRIRRKAYAHASTPRTSAIQLHPFFVAGHVVSTRSTGYF